MTIEQNLSSTTKIISTNNTLNHNEFDSITNTETLPFVETIIIGAGFSGLCLAYYLQQRKYDKYIVLESRPDWGGQLQLYDYKNIYDIPTVKKITAKDLRNNMYNVVSNDKILFGCGVEGISMDNNCKIIEYYDSKDKKHRKIPCNQVVAACGKGEMKPMTISNDNVKNLEQLNKIFYSINDSYNVKNKTVAVLGGGDSAMDFIDHVSKDAAKIYLIHRRPIFTAMAAKLTSVKSLTNCEVLSNYQIISLENHNPITINICSGEDKQTQKTLLVDLIFVFYGFQEDNSFITKVFGEKKIKVNKGNMKPTADNHIIDYVIGDLGEYEGKRFLLNNYMAECDRVSKQIATSSII